MTPEREVELFAKLELLLELYRRSESDAAAMRAEMSGLRTDLRSQMDAFRAEVRSDMDGFKADIRSDMDSFKADIRSDMDSFKAEVRGQLDGFRGELRQTNSELRELRIAQQDCNNRISRVEGRVEEQSKFLQLVLASRQPRKAAG